MWWDWLPKKILFFRMKQGGGGDCIKANGRRNSSGSANDTLTVTENQVAKLMEEDMGSAMQYLQGKGLCLMPISLATAISTATCQSGRPPASNGDGPTSPSMSVLTAQSAARAPESSSAKDATSSKWWWRGFLSDVDPTAARARGSF